MNWKNFLPFFSFFVFALYCKGQQNQGSDLVQFSGVVVSGDSLNPIPFASILVRNEARGTISDYFGFFSFVAQKGDTIEFTCVGYKKSFYKIPDTLRGDKYSLIQMLTTDTVLLGESFVRPWPTQEQFREAFLNLKIPDDDLVRARRNLARYEMKEKWETTAMDGSLNYKTAMQQKQSQLYYIGQYQPNNLLNPIAWANFIEAWQRGDFKKKEPKETE